MIPFCRTLTEGYRVVEEMAKSGLHRGEDGLRIYVMCEIPNKVILATEFAAIFDGFSIGSNDLTQLTLGVAATPSSWPTSSPSATPGSRSSSRW
jgi:pyruvate,water dikinase